MVGDREVAALVGHGSILRATQDFMSAPANEGTQARTGGLGEV